MTSLLEQSLVAPLTEWPTGRFVIAGIDHEDLWDSAIVGCGVAFPDHVVFELSEPVRSIDALLDRLRRAGDVRVIWVAQESGPSDEGARGERAEDFPYTL
jgi:hypothetical protein